MRGPPPSLSDYSTIKVACHENTLSEHLQPPQIE